MKATAAAVIAPGPGGAVPPRHWVCSIRLAVVQSIVADTPLKVVTAIFFNRLEERQNLLVSIRAAFRICLKGS